jgi:DNA-binding response OmpR family regulator
MTRVLLISDDEHGSKPIVEMLAREHFAPALVRNGQGGLETACRIRPQLAIVDLHHSSLANFELCRQLRASQIPAAVIVLSAVAHEADKVLLLEGGADDYIVKPFCPRELLARIRALLRRTLEQIQILKFADIDVDLIRRVVSKGGQEVKLTRAEYNLLAYFLRHSDRVVTRDMILNSAWGYDYFPNTRTVDIHIMRLRQKLEPNPSVVRHFRTVHGVGYRFVPHT